VPACPAAVFGFSVALNAVEPCDAQPNVTAPGGVAVGREIANSAINIYSREPEEIKQLAEQLDRSEVPIEQLAKKLVEIAENYKDALVARCTEPA
jgi:hypothetical protein